MSVSEGLIFERKLLSTPYQTPPAVIDAAFKFFCESLEAGCYPRLELAMDDLMKIRMPLTLLLTHRSIEKLTLSVGSHSFIIELVENLANAQVKIAAPPVLKPVQGEQLSVTIHLKGPTTSIARKAREDIRRTKFGDIKLKFQEEEITVEKIETDKLLGSIGQELFGDSTRLLYVSNWLEEVVSDYGTHVKGVVFLIGEDKLVVVPLKAPDLEELKTRQEYPKELELSKVGILLDLNIEKNYLIEEPIQKYRCILCEPSEVIAEPRSLKLFFFKEVE